MPRPHRCRCVLCAALGLALALLLALLAPRPAVAGDPVPKKPVSFINDVAPILKENCFACHDAKKRKGKLDMTTFENLRKGGTKDFDPIVDGKPEESYLVELINGTGAARMPPEESGDGLPKEKIAVIEQWVKEGAKLDGGIAPQADLPRELRRRWQPPEPKAAYDYAVNVTALAFTPDGKKVVVGGNHELTVWDAAGGKLEKRVRTRAERAYAMAFLPDGKLAVAGGRPGQEGDVGVYDLNGGKPRVDGGVAFLDGVHDKGVLVARLGESDDSVLCLALSPDGKKLAAGGCDRLVHVWDVSGGAAAAKLEQSIENHADWVFGVAFSPDGKQLFTASRDKTAKVWDLAAKESVVTFPGHQNAVYGVAVQPDGKAGISAGEDNRLRAWAVASDAKQLREGGGHGKAVFKVVPNPKQPLLASCSADGSVRLWNATNLAPGKTLSGHTDWVYSVAFSPDGTLVAAGAYNGEVRVWKVADGSLMKAFNATPGLKTEAAVPKK
jgi:DNA-binding beta-propeller fold protein YncE